MVRIRKRMGLQLGISWVRRRDLAFGISTRRSTRKRPKRIVSRAYSDSVKRSQVHRSPDNMAKLVPELVPASSRTWVASKRKCLLCRHFLDSGGGIRTRDLRVMSFVRGVGWTTWNPVSSGIREIELRGVRLEYVGHVAPFVAPEANVCSSSADLPD